MSLPSSLVEPLKVPFVHVPVLIQEGFREIEHAHAPKHTVKADTLGTDNITEHHLYNSISADISVFLKCRQDEHASHALRKVCKTR